jgi:hypothetical protein
MGGQRQDRAPMRAPVVSGESASVYRSARHPGPAHNDHRMVKQSGQVKTVRDGSALKFCQDQAWESGARSDQANG